MGLAPRGPDGPEVRTAGGMFGLAGPLVSRYGDAGAYRGHDSPLGMRLGGAALR